MENYVPSGLGTTLDKIINFILYPQFEGIFLYIKILFIVISLLLIAAIIYFLFINSWLKRFILEDLTETITTRPYGAKRTFKHWNRIQKRMGAKTEDEYRLAIIEADNLLDDVLTKMGYEGDSILDKLNQISETVLPNVKQVLEAHQLRNNIVHDPDYKISPESISKAMDIYEKALHDLEAF
jgi:hypothetical protein